MNSQVVITFFGLLKVEEKAVADHDSHKDKPNISAIF